MTRKPGKSPKRAREAIPADLEGLDPSEDAWRHHNIGRLLIVAYNAFSERVVQAIRASGYPEVRLAHLNLVRSADSEHGTRLVELARRVGIGKAAMGQLVREGAKLGLFSIDNDATDGRARIVRFTAKGRALHKVVRREVIKAEQEFEAILGRARHARVREGLLTLRQRLADELRTGTPSARRRRARGRMG
jgi:DNA-binding MarR family transcriptional regulator